MHSWLFYQYVCCSLTVNPKISSFNITVFSKTFFFQTQNTKAILYTLYIVSSSYIVVIYRLNQSRKKSNINNIIKSATSSNGNGCNQYFSRSFFTSFCDPFYFLLRDTLLDSFSYCKLWLGFCKNKKCGKKIIYLVRRAIYTYHRHQRNP